MGIVLSFIMGAGVRAQVQLDALYLKNALHQPAKSMDFSQSQFAKLNTFYAELQYTPVWLRVENRSLLESFFRLVSCAEYEALNADDYAVKELTNFISLSKVLVSTEDSLALELRISLAAIDFFTDLKYGNQSPEFGYTGFTYNHPSIIPLVAQHVNERSLDDLPGKIIPQLPEVARLAGKLGEILARMQRLAGWDPDINSIELSNNNIPLTVKLYHLGIIDNADAKLADTEWVHKIMAVQRMFNLQADGKAGKQTMQQLNIPIETRIQEISRSINYYKWLSGISAAQRVVLVNIPSARLTVYDRNAAVLTMRMILGKPSTPTPTLTAVIDKLVLYPFWTVPRSIAVKELLPVFKRDPGYVQAGNYQVLTKAGKLVNPKDIQWSAYNALNFPFTLRQSTGCDNALGLLKLDFENPYGVYLHDTPVKILFASSNRFMSHGCMRMEHPMEMGKMLLGEDTRAIDTLTEKGCLKNQAPIIVAAKEKMPVVVWYNTVTADRSGAIVFYGDVYHKLSWTNKNQ